LAATTVTRFAAGPGRAGQRPTPVEGEGCCRAGLRSVRVTVRGPPTPRPGPASRRWTRCCSGRVPCRSGGAARPEGGGVSRFWTREGRLMLVLNREQEYQLRTFSICIEFCDPVRRRIKFCCRSALRRDFCAHKKMGKYSENEHILFLLAICNLVPSQT